MIGRLRGISMKALFMTAALLLCLQANATEYSCSKSYVHQKTAKLAADIFESYEVDTTNVQKHSEEVRVNEYHVIYDITYKSGLHWVSIVYMDTNGYRCTFVDARSGKWTN